MSTLLEGLRARMIAQADALLDSIASAETIIVSTIERECEALRTGRMLAAEALHLRLLDAARLYLNATKAARASLWTLERVLPGIHHEFEERRLAFADLLQIELAVLAAERAAADQSAAVPVFATSQPAGPSSGPQQGGPAKPAVRLVSDRQEIQSQQAPAAPRWSRR